MIATLDCSKSTGVDGLSAHFLKISLRIFLKPITAILNHSISECQIPINRLIFSNPEI